MFEYSNTESILLIINCILFIINFIATFKTIKSNYNNYVVPDIQKIYMLFIISPFIYGLISVKSLIFIQIWPTIHYISFIVQAFMESIILNSFRFLFIAHVGGTKGF